MNTRLHGLSLLASLFLVLMAVAVTMGVPFYFCIRLGGLLLISTFMVGLVTALVKETSPGPGRGTSASRYYYEQQVQAIRRLHFDSTGSFHGPTLHDMHRIVPFRPDGWYDQSGNLVTDKDLLVVLNRAKDAHPQDE